MDDLAPRSRESPLYVIQAFRGVAAMLVVFFHATQLFASEYQVVPLHGFFLFGFSGVHLFFVLSGFIIFTIHHRDIGEPRKYLVYLKKRFVRIYPIYWVTLAVFSFWALLKGTVTGGDILLNMGLFNMPQNFINPVCWTLSFEVFFYLLFSFLILNRRVGLVLMCSWFFGVVISHLFDVHVPFIFRYSVHKFTILFMFGAIASHMVMRLKQFSAAIRHQVACIALLSGVLVFSAMAIYCVKRNISDWDLWTVTLGFGLAGGLLMGCSLSDTFDQFFRRLRFLTIPGDASYSIYLLHYPVLVGMISWSRNHFPLPTSGSMVFAFITACLLTILGGLLCYWIIEKPLLQAIRHRTKVLLVGP